jgi:hypothetical protein
VCIGTAPIGFLHIGLLANLLGAPMAIAILSGEGLVALAVACRVWPEVLGGQGLGTDESPPRDART